MINSDQNAKNNLLYPRSRYHGTFTPSNLAFNANLQEFSQRVSYISALQTGGKLSPEQAYKQIKTLWKQLKRTRKTTEVGADWSSDE